MRLSGQGQWLRLLGWLLLLCTTASHADTVLESADSLANRVIALAEQRLGIMPEVAAAKMRAGQPVTDPAREAAVLAQVVALGQAAGLDTQGVEGFFELQMRFARERQTALLGEWQQKGIPDSIPQRSLSDDLRPRIDAVNRELIVALYLAAPFSAAGLSSQATGSSQDADAPGTDHRALITDALGKIRLSAVPGIDRARAAGVLRIGVPADYAPFAYLDGDRLLGSDVAITGALAKALGLRAVYIHTSWRTLAEDLAADRFDIAAGGVSVTAERAASGEFSVPLARSGKSALGRCADRDRFASDAAIDVAGVRVIENPGGTNERFARGHLHEATLRIHADNVTIFAELLAGRADVMYTDDIEITRVTRLEPGLCRLISESFEPADKALFMARNSGWKPVIDRWLQDPRQRRLAQRALENALEE